MINIVKRNIIPNLSKNQIQNSFAFKTKAFLLNYYHLAIVIASIYLLGIEKDKGFDKIVLFIGGGFSIYVLLPFYLKQFFMVVMAFAILLFAVGLQLAISVFVMLIICTLVTYVKQKMVRYLIAFIISLIGFLFFAGFINQIWFTSIFYYTFLYLMLRYFYLIYEVSYFKSPPTFIERINYLFLFHNIAFPLFTPIDPKAFFSSYFVNDFNSHFKQGLTWITRGILHTVLYRIIYMFIMPSPYEVHDFYSLLLFLLAGYAMMLRLSGLFYCGIGFIMIFGYKFPPIFNNYFFASGFADFWRRINLYWYDFIMRLVYYPLVMRFKKLPPYILIFFTTIFLFFVSWLLHDWQWFWIRGNWPSQWNDFLFWMILGLFIAISASIRIQKKKFEKTKYTLTKAFVNASKVIMMWFIMSILWSLWTSDSITEWIYLLGFYKVVSNLQIILFLGVLLVVLLLSAILNYYSHKEKFAFIFKEPGQVLSMFLAIFILLFTLYAKYFDETLVLQKIANMNLNQRDKSIMERGYYEHLLNNDLQKIALMNLNNKTGTKWNLDNDAYNFTNNELIKEFKEKYSTSFKGDSVITNSFGIRDKEYSIIKDTANTRIAVLGGSYEMGSGVSNSENYPALFEELLNKKFNNAYEVLNFAVGGYHLPQAVYLTQNKLQKFNPDVLIYVAHSNELSRLIENMVKIIDKKVIIKTSELNNFIRKAGITPNMCRIEKYNRLKYYDHQISYWCYATIADWCNMHNVKPVWVYLPVSVDLRTDTDKLYIAQIAADLGFTCIDLGNVYEGYKGEQIQISEWDTHPNELGHKLIANKLFNQFINKKSIFNRK